MRVPCIMPTVLRLNLSLGLSLGLALGCRLRLSACHACSRGLLPCSLQGCLDLMNRSTGHKSQPHHKPCGQEPSSPPLLTASVGSRSSADACAAACPAFSLPAWLSTAAPVWAAAVAFCLTAPQTSSTCGNRPSCRCLRLDFGSSAKLARRRGPTPLSFRFCKRVSSHARAAASALAWLTASAALRARKRRNVSQASGDACRFRPFQRANDDPPVAGASGASSPTTPAPALLAPSCILPMPVAGASRATKPASAKPSPPAPATPHCNLPMPVTGASGAVSATNPTSALNARSCSSPMPVAGAFGAAQENASATVLAPAILAPSCNSPVPVAGPSGAASATAPA